MNHCPQCATVVFPNSEFCHKCGKKYGNSLEENTQRDLDDFANSIKQCKIGTQTLLHAVREITGNIVQFKNTRRMNGELMHEYTKNMNDFLDGVGKLEKGITAIEKIQPDTSASRSDVSSDEYIKNINSIVISSREFFDAIDFDIRYIEDGTETSAKLSQFAEMEHMGKAIRNANDFTLDGQTITHCAEILVSDCESFIEYHNNLFEQTEYSI